MGVDYTPEVESHGEDGGEHGGEDDDCWCAFLSRIGLFYCIMDSGKRGTSKTGRPQGFY